MSGSLGDGAGKGGGTGGSIRDAGGAFGRMQAAREEEHFYKKVSRKIQLLLIQNNHSFKLEKLPKILFLFDKLLLSHLSKF